eukprot:CAMPEP_0174297468 /NCGR_PEP_ID=MMETSP0809-20121228/51083_1 /TAXON_ID=73025 ORGANISM="Eutreptiella gymnastica-like, Strain CCMP1594" /NCGR_SAMPLE_ID=MMETSP0809 /ASSEMBLY_ACC=CAM_ASM_000658 /LENGTH=43 /DNA_ID= /DNA_START= /DNA_END= /DNA_ORIENTATION=
MGNAKVEREIGRTVDPLYAQAPMRPLPHLLAHPLASQKEGVMG